MSIVKLRKYNIWIKIGNNDTHLSMEETSDILSIIFLEKTVIARNLIKCLVHNTFHTKNTSYFKYFYRQD